MYALPSFPNLSSDVLVVIRFPFPIAACNVDTHSLQHTFGSCSFPSCGTCSCSATHNANQAGFGIGMLLVCCLVCCCYGTHSRYESLATPGSAMSRCRFHCNKCNTDLCLPCGEYAYNACFFVSSPLSIVPYLSPSTPADTQGIESTRLASSRHSSSLPPALPVSFKHRIAVSFGAVV